jgi:hypothetical protein
MGTCDAVEAGTTVSTEFMYEFDRYVTITGTFVATLKIEVSNDGTTWAQSGSDVTAPGCVAVSGRTKFTRFRCSAFTSGAAVGTLFGIQSSEN